MESGAKFAGFGFVSEVTTARETAAAGVAMLVVDTETRHVPAEAAYANVLQLARRFTPRLIYKKTDSTLRGNIAAEFRALLEAFPDRPLVYAPAYPEMGRTVVGGILFVWGEPVHTTPFAQDPLNPILESDLRVLLGGLAVTLLDGKSSQDVKAAATTVLSYRPHAIAAGPAALAEALASCLTAHPGYVPKFPRAPRCLVVNGSRHPASASQIDHALHFGLLNWEILDHRSDAEGLSRAAHTGRQVRRLLQSRSFDGLVVFGGDTAFAIHEALGAPPFTPYGEVLPGVPLSRCGDLIWITKAGGFGSSDLLRQLHHLLT